MTTTAHPYVAPGTDSRADASGPEGACDRGWHAAWVAALDDLELTLEETQRLLAAGDAGEVLASAPWTPPQMATPLPAELLDRARGLLARQHELMGLTVTAMSGARKDIVALGKVSTFAGAARSERSVYLDIRA